jgi:hypothetical protein
MKLIAILFGMLVSSYSLTASAIPNTDASMLAKAQPYIQTLKQEIANLWPDMPIPSYFAAQIEQESLWNPRAELKTAREYGFGFGQFTITPKFNAFTEVKAMSPRLKSWDYDDRFNPQMQIIAVIVKNKANYVGCKPLMKNDWESMACVAASYNGGYGGFVSDRRLCGNTKGCDPGKWWGNVENTSLKSRTKWQGYGKSAYEINREYPILVLKTRRAKWVNVFEGFQD